MKARGVSSFLAARVFAPWLVLVALGLTPCHGEQTNIYSTSFEPGEGYNPAYELIGQKSWTGYGADGGGNGLLTNFFGQQAAYIGAFPLSPPSDFLSVWQPLPLLNTNFSSVKFSVVMSIEDSTNDEWDEFYWSVYNQLGDRLFSLDFDNYEWGIHYLLDGTNDFVFTGVRFTNGHPYTLTLTMDFSKNTWSALLDTITLATNLPITTVNSRLNLGDIDAGWSIYSTNAPGDNFMAFDSYQVVALTTTPPVSPVSRLAPAGHTALGSFILRLTGTSGSRWAIEATTNTTTWVALKTNTVSDGYFDFVDSAAAALPNRYYRARSVAP